VALGIVLVSFVVALFAAGAIAGVVIATIEDAPVAWPSAWLLARGMAAGWLILATWAALGVLLGIATRGTSLAIGLGILYALVVAGLLSAFAASVSLLEPLTRVFLRANGYSLATALGAPPPASSPMGPAPSAARSSTACRRSWCSSCSPRQVPRSADAASRRARYQRRARASRCCGYGRSARSAA